MRVCYTHGGILYTRTYNEMSTNTLSSTCTYTYTRKRTLSLTQDDCCGATVQQVLDASFDIACEHDEIYRILVAENETYLQPTVLIVRICEHIPGINQTVIVVYAKSTKSIVLVRRYRTDWLEYICHILSRTDKTRHQLVTFRQFQILLYLRFMRFMRMAFWKLRFGFCVCLHGWFTPRKELGLSSRLHRYTTLPHCRLVSSCEST